MSVYGIDLGTTYCKIVKIDENGNPQTIKNTWHSLHHLASLIQFENDGSVLIGDEDYDISQSKNVIKNILRNINEETIHVLDNKYKPVELLAMILKALKNMVEDQGEIGSEAVISVPACFGYKERYIITQAAEIAGWHILDLINNTTASALYYFFDNPKDKQNILIYDLGGSTFNCALVNQNGSNIEILSADGHQYLGGIEFDNALLQVLKEKISDYLQIDEDLLDNDIINYFNHRKAFFKDYISIADIARFIVPYDEKIIIQVTRKEFEELTMPLVDQTMTIVKKTIENASIDKVILVGGCCKMPIIFHTLYDQFPHIVHYGDRELSNAKGAALYADMLVHEERRDFHITDYVSRSIGIESDGYIYNIFKIGQKLNDKITKTYYTTIDNQEKITFHIYENASLEDTFPLYETIDILGFQYVASHSETEVKELGKIEIALSGNDSKGTAIDIEWNLSASHLSAKVVSSSDIYEIKLDDINTKDMNVRYIKE